MTSDTTDSEDRTVDEEVADAHGLVSGRRRQRLASLLRLRVGGRAATVSRRSRLGVTFWPGRTRCRPRMMTQSSGPTPSRTTRKPSYQRARARRCAAPPCRRRRRRRRTCWSGRCRSPRRGAAARCSRPSPCTRTRANSAGREQPLRVGHHARGRAACRCPASSRLSRKSSVPLCGKPRSSGSADLDGRAERRRRPRPRRARASRLYLM